LSKNLGKQVKSRLSWDIAGTFFKQIIVLVTVILVRLLTPVEFGVVGLAMVFISLSEMFPDVDLLLGTKKERLIIRL
jgi:O-antigen/teichoic acid export membrane protein